jgi:hypothetical protein
MKRERERLLTAYHELQGGGTKLQFARALKHPVSREVSQPDTLRLGPVAQMESLHATVQELDVELVWELMAIYFVDKSWNEFLDCYLLLLTQAPEKTSGLWARSALECSWRCGRTAEVKDALEHLLRFHPEIKATRAVEATLVEWKMNHPVTLEHAN